MRLVANVPRIKELRFRCRNKGIGDGGREIEVVETTVGQAADVLERLGVSKERRVTILVEPDDWLTQARQESRRLVIAAGLSDADTDRLIKQARREVEPPPARHQRHRHSWRVGLLND